MSENIVKQTAKELGMTQKELAERMGVAEQTVRNWASKDGVAPAWGIKFMEALLENKNMEDELKDFNKFKEVLKNLTK